jgi:hypothetical protein
MSRWVPLGPVHYCQLLMARDRASSRVCFPLERMFQPPTQPSRAFATRAQNLVAFFRLVSPRRNNCREQGLSLPIGMAKGISNPQCYVHLHFLHHVACLASHNRIPSYPSNRSSKVRQSSPDLYSENRNLNDWTGLPSQIAATRWL